MKAGLFQPQGGDIYEISSAGAMSMQYVHEPLHMSTDLKNAVLIQGGIYN